MSSANQVRSGDLVLLYLTARKRWLVRAIEGEKLHTHRGIVDFNDVIGANYGSTVSTTLSEKLWIMMPSIRDLLMKSERPTQVVYPKDLGAIAAFSGLGPGKRVVEAGAGSGVLTAFMANLVRPNGRIYSFEIRPEFFSVAERNLKKMDLLEYVTLKNVDLQEGLDVTEADIAVLDLGDPWNYVQVMRGCLVAGGMLVSICPTMNQVEKLVEKLEEELFIDIESMEIMLRGLAARTGMTRPNMRMIGHTAYLTFARKTIDPNKG